MKRGYDNRDRNEPEIVEALTRIGAYVKRMPPNSGFDLLVILEGQKEIVEVKREGDNRLTDVEKTFKAAWEAAGGKYHIAHSAEEALKIFGY